MRGQMILEFEKNKALVKLQTIMWNYQRRCLFLNLKTKLSDDRYTVSSNVPSYVIIRKYFTIVPGCMIFVMKFD
jgi:hypothetical protein